MATTVIFRKWPKREGGDCIALFPFAHVGMYPGWHCSSYEHVGQHGPAYYPHVIQKTKPAKPEEYADLLRELVHIGYDDLVIRKRANRSTRRK